MVKALGPVKERLRRESKSLVMTAGRFADQLEKHDRFARRLYDESKIFVIGDEFEFGKLAEDRAT